MIALAPAHLDARIRGGERAQQRWDQEGCHGNEAADIQPSRIGNRAAPPCGLDLPRIGEHVAGADREVASGVGEHQVAPAAAKQFLTKRFFEKV